MRIREYLVEIFDTDYQVRELKYDTYQVTKWIKGKNPDNIYNILKYGGSWSCDCPVRGKCKHIDLVKKWIKDGKPNKFI